MDLKPVRVEPESEASKQFSHARCFGFLLGFLPCLPSVMDYDPKHKPGKPFPPCVAQSQSVLPQQQKEKWESCERTENHSNLTIVSNPTPVPFPTLNVSFSLSVFCSAELQRLQLTYDFTKSIKMM